VKRLLLVGGVGCGKTTLLQRLEGTEIHYAKTGEIYTSGGVIDTFSEEMGDDLGEDADELVEEAEREIYDGETDSAE